MSAVPDPAAEERFARYWDAITRGAPEPERAALGAGVDPELRDLIARMRDLRRASHPDPAFRRQLEHDLMHAPTAPSSTLLPWSVTVPHALNGHAAPTSGPAPGVGPMRRPNWTWAQPVLALLLVAALLTGYLVASRQQQGSAGNPAVATPTADATPGDWPMYRGAPDRSGAMPGPGLLSQPAVLWQFKVDAAAGFGTPIVDGVVYLSTEVGTLYALDAATGEVRWQIPASFAMPAVSDGILYYVSPDEALVALDLNTRQELWRATPGTRFWTPTISGGVLYYGADANLLVARDARTGAEKWASEQTTQSSRSAALADGVLVAGSDDHTLYAVDAATGATKWSVPLGDENSTILMPAIADGTVYAGTFSGDQNVFAALDLQTGAERWRLAAESGEDFQPAGIANGLVFLPTTAGTLRALDAATGAVRWTYTSTGEMRAAPAVVDGIVYAVGMDGILLALDAASGAELWRLPLGEPSAFGPAVVDGHLYLGTDTGSFFAIGSVGEQRAISTPRAPVITPPPAQPTPPSAPAAANTDAAAPTPAANQAAAPANLGFIPPPTFLWQATGGEDGLYSAAALAIAPDGTIWVVDAGKHRIQIFSPEGAYLESWDGTGGGGAPFNFANHNGGYDADVAFDPAGNTFVTSSGDRSMQSFAPDRTLRYTVGGRTSDEFSEPIGVAADSAGNAYVMDNARNVVKKFDPSGALIATIDGDGPANFREVAYIGIDASDHIWLAADDRIVEITSDGEFIRDFGSHGDGPGQFMGSTDVAVDANGIVYATDFEHGWIQVYTSDGVQLAVWDAGRRPSGGQNLPFAVAPDNQGNLYIVGLGPDAKTNSSLEKLRLPALPAPVAEAATPAP